MWKRWILGVLLCIGLSVGAYGQGTTLTLNVTDSGSQAWGNGTYALTFVGAPNAQWPGGAIKNFSGSLGATGSVSVSNVPDVNTITPSPSFWQVKVCPNPAISTTQCFIGNFTVTGSTLTLNITPPAISIPVPNTPTVIPPVTAYADAEISGGWVGFQYFQYNAATPASSASRVCQVLTGNACTTWAAAGGGGTSPNGATIYAWDPKYNLPSPAKWVCDATFTLNSPTVTTPSTDIPFLATDSFAIVVGGAVACGGNAQQAVTTLTPANATATFVGAHTITLSGNALANCTPTAGQGGCALFWGADATAAVQSAFNDAVTGCGTLVLPAGGVIINAVVGTSSAACPVTDNGDDKVSAITIMGQGPFSTMLLFTPNVSFTRTMFSWSNAGTNSAARTNMHDFGVASFTSAPAALNGQTGFFANFNSDFYNIWFMDFFPSNAQNFIAVLCNGVVNAVTNCHNLMMINSGFTSIKTNGQDVNIYDNWVQGATNLFLYSPAGLPGTLVTRDNRFTISGTQGAVNVPAGAGLWHSYGDRFNGSGTSLPVVSIAGAAGNVVVFHDARISGSQTTGASLSIAASNTVIFDGVSNNVSASSGTANAITNAGTLTLKNTGFSSSGGTGLNNSGTVTFLTGNTIANGFTNTGTVIGGVGDCASSGGTCANASNGSVSIAAGATTVTVATTAVGANSEILIQEDSTLGTKLGVTCNTTAGRTYVVTTRTAGTSFVITASAAPTTNPACLHYSIREGSSVE